MGGTRAEIYAGSDYKREIQVARDAIQAEERRAGEIRVRLRLLEARVAMLRSHFTAIEADVSRLDDARDHRGRSTGRRWCRKILRPACPARTIRHQH